MKGTKEKLLHAAIEVWSKDPTASLDEIANYSGITRRTLHRHFDGRTELVSTVLNRLVSKYLESIERISDENEELIETRLQKLFFNDVTSSDKYFLYKSLVSNELSHYAEMNSKVQVLYSLYHQTFNDLLENQLIRTYSIEWLETFYSACVKATVDMCKRDDDNRTMLIGWQLFWNALKQ